jgi:hypothetical protein
MATTTISSSKVKARLCHGLIREILMKPPFTFRRQQIRHLHPSLKRSDNELLRPAFTGGPIPQRLPDSSKKFQCTEIRNPEWSPVFRKSAVAVVQWDGKNLMHARVVANGHRFAVGIKHRRFSAFDGAYDRAASFNSSYCTARVQHLLSKSSPIKTLVSEDDEAIDISQPDKIQSPAGEGSVVAHTDTHVQTTDISKDLW